MHADLDLGFDALTPTDRFDSLPAIADGVEHSLDPRAVALQRIAGWIVTGSVSIGLLLVLAIILTVSRPPAVATGSLALLWAAATLALAWWSNRWPEIAYRHAAYTVDGRGIEVRRGVVWRNVVNVPRSRVQHIDVAQGPLERRYGLGTLVVYTAGTDHAKVDLRGLDHATALRIRDHLLPGDGRDAI
ncbi:MAG: PH domain-containing protein [Gemmatimonadota bacterium]|nr:PH domain-containing protein [Gemmatimonadota bacterium]